MYSKNNLEDNKNIYHFGKSITNHDIKIDEKELKKHMLHIGNFNSSLTYQYFEELFKKNHAIIILNGEDNQIVKKTIQKIADKYNYSFKNTNFIKKEENNYQIMHPLNLEIENLVDIFLNEEREMDNDQKMWNIRTKLLLNVWLPIIKKEKKDHVYQLDELIKTLELDYLIENKNEKIKRYLEILSIFQKGQEKECHNYTKDIIIKRLEQLFQYNDLFSKDEKIENLFQEKTIYYIELPEIEKLENKWVHTLLGKMIKENVNKNFFMNNKDFKKAIIFNHSIYFKNLYTMPSQARFFNIKLIFNFNSLSQIVNILKEEIHVLAMLSNIMNVFYSKSNDIKTQENIEVKIKEINQLKINKNIKNIDLRLLNNDNYIVYSKKRIERLKIKNKEIL